MTRKRKRQRVVTIAVAFLVTSSLLTVGVGALQAESATSDGVVAVQETTAEEQANVSVRNLSAPAEVELGQNFTVSATVVNERDEEVIRDVSYRIAGNVLATQLVRLPAGATETVTFNVSGDDTSGFPTGTFVQGVFTGDAEATANLTIVAAGETPEETETPEENETEIAENETETPQENETEIAANETTTETPTEVENASIVFENQTSNGTVVTLQSVTVPEGGFVAIHDRSIVAGNVSGSFLGVSEYLEPGTHETVTVQLNENLNESQSLVAIAYRDTNGNQTFDFFVSNRTVDGPYTQPGASQAVNDFAFVTIAENVTETTEETETPANETTTVAEDETEIADNETTVANETETPEENETEIAENETETPEENETEIAENETETPEENETEIAENETETVANETETPAEVETASIVFENQTSNGTVVTLQSVTVPEGGFVAIHDRSIVAGNVSGSFLGVSEYLEPGTHENVTVQLNENLNESQSLVAVAYRNTDDDQTFDFFAANRTVDGPYTQQGAAEAVNDFAFVTIEDNETQQNETQG